MYRGEVVSIYRASVYLQTSEQEKSILTILEALKSRGLRMMPATVTNMTQIIDM